MKIIKNIPMKCTFTILMLFLVSGLLNAQQEGFFNFTWDEEKGRILLDINNLGEEFLYVNSLAAGVGSNDIGLDRGQLGSDRVVRFERVGNKILLIQPNLRYRALSDNPAERRAMEEAFAQSVIGGFSIEKEENGTVTIDLTPFILRDAHGVAETLKSRGQGTYKLDAKRSAVYLENTLSFPDNTEFEATLTFGGKPEGREIRSVTPDPKSVSVRLHHSFVRLPDNDYTPRKYHPYSGFFNINYYDYATPISEPLNKKFIVRHRLEKKNPEAERSDAVEPIIYYIDPGCPEPVKTALMEGAAWWNQAFEAAGYIDAFQIKELPEGAHPLDVRYNMIQWVHRSTRGWSYGASVVDPRTGEIIKGHVSLGSLRVRQDFMIAQGILSPYGEDPDNHGPMMEIALARLRQLSAHEVGHTLGLAHNFAASVNDRASVMDYPHPVIDLVDGRVDYSEAYDDKIGAWDKRAILYGYGTFTNTESDLEKVIRASQEDGLRFISDPDARPQSGAHPEGHLWDNGANPVDELERINKVRAHALENFGAETIPEGTPYSELEKVLVPVFLMQRYQVEAVAKLIGGLNYTYAVKGDALDPKISPVSDKMQAAATASLLHTLKPSYLRIPDDILEIVPPAAYGYGRSRESFSSTTGLVFDPYGAAYASADHTLSLLLNAARLSRIDGYGGASLSSYLDLISDTIFDEEAVDHAEQKIKDGVSALFVQYLIHLSLHAEDSRVAGLAKYALEENLMRDTDLPEETAHLKYLQFTVDQAFMAPDEWKMEKPAEIPPGSPIGCGH